MLSKREELKLVKAVLERHKEELTALEVGYGVTSGEDGELVILILAINGEVPENLPKEIEGIPVVVEELDQWPSINQGS